MGHKTTGIMFGSVIPVRDLIVNEDDEYALIENTEDLEHEPIMEFFKTESGEFVLAGYWVACSRKKDGCELLPEVTPIDDIDDLFETEIYIAQIHWERLRLAAVRESNSSGKIKKYYPAGKLHLAEVNVS